MKAKKDWEKTKGLGTNQQAQARTNKRMGGPKLCTITQGPSSFEYRKEKEKRHLIIIFFFRNNAQASVVTHARHQVEKLE
jgi:hypothetical protein